MLHAVRPAYTAPPAAAVSAGLDCGEAEAYSGCLQHDTSGDKCASGCRGEEEKEPLIRKTGAPEFDATLEPGRTPDKGR